MKADLGNAPAHKLFELVNVSKKAEANPPRSYSDYEVTVNKAGMPQGVDLIEML
jgi:CRISPR-associated protein Csd2